MRDSVFRAELVPWVTPPGHFGAQSKYLAGPDTHGSQYLDFRVSTYQQGGHVASHVHQVAEHVYYVLQGIGLVELEGRQHLVEPNTTVFVPHGVAHAVANSGLDDLILIVVTSPPSDIPR